MNVFKDVGTDSIYQVNDKINDIILLADDQYIDSDWRERPFIYYDNRLYIGHTYDFTFNQEHDPDLPEAEDVPDTHMAMIDRIFKNSKTLKNLRFDFNDETTNTSLAFGHIIDKNVAIIESSSAQNISMSYLASLLKEEGYKKIYVSDNTDTKLLRVAKLLNKLF